MRYPEWLKKGDTIGVTAPSGGCVKELDVKRFYHAKEKLQQLGYQVIFTPNTFTSDQYGRSSLGKTRGEQWNELAAMEQVKMINSAKGGDYLVEMLPFVDWELFRENPKWFQGYSDNTGLIHTITTKYDIAALYGGNFGEFGMEPWEPCVLGNLEILEGKSVVQKSFDMYEADFHDRVTGLEGFSKDKPVYWKNKNNKKRQQLQGRLLGGCLDVLLNLCGTKYDNTLEFIDKYKEDGILWYLESFDTSAENLMMGLWHLKELGWFEYASGIVFGRPLFYKSFGDMSYEEAACMMLQELELPMIFDADIGHMGPQFTMINGAVAKVSCENGKGELIYI